MMKNEQDAPSATEQVKRDESQVGGYYHGPSNQAGLTNREYWEMMDMWEDEKARLRDEW